MDYSSVKINQLLPIKRIIEDDELTRLDKDFAILSLLTGMSVDKLESLKFKTANFLRGEVNFLFEPVHTQPFRLRSYIIVKGRIYKFLSDASKFSANRYLSIKAALDEKNGGFEANLNRIAALCYKPLFSAGAIDEQGNYKDLHVKDRWEMYKDFSDVKVSKVIGGVFFYLNVSRSLNDWIQIYLSDLNQELTTMAQEINPQDKHLQSTTDGRK